MSENRHNRGLLAGWIVCFFPFVVASTAIAQPPSPPCRAEGRPAQIEDPYRFTPTYSPKLSEASAEERSVRERAMQQEREAAPRPARAAQGARPRGPGRAPETKPGDPVIIGRLAGRQATSSESAFNPGSANTGLRRVLHSTASRLIRASAQRSHLTISYHFLGQLSCQPASRFHFRNRVARRLARTPSWLEIGIG